MQRIIIYFLILYLFLSKNILAQEYNAETVNIPIAPMEPFSGLSREAILDKRQNAVQNSIFADSLIGYAPNYDVFQIESGLPWISAHEITCYGHGTNGASRESFGILNPPVLYYPLMASYNFSQNTGCSDIDYLLVHKLTYKPQQNLIIAYIDYTSFYRKNKVFYRIHLSDTNARDLGYHYAYATEAKNIKFAESQNLSNTITPTRGLYHRGGSCGVSGGCNNYSPRQTELEFYLTDLPAELYIKLWKVHPLDAYDRSDIDYRLIFE